VEDGKIEDFLAERGFALRAHYAPADLEAAYLAAADGTRPGRINETHRIATAEVKAFH
jgi:hypothetical protein